MVLQKPKEEMELSKPIGNRIAGHFEKTCNLGDLKDILESQREVPTIFWNTFREAHIKRFPSCGP